MLLLMIKKGRKKNVKVRNECKNRIEMNMPGELTCRFPALMTCKVQRPSAFSPQKWTLRKGQSSKLELRTSRGRSKRSVEVVPMGEVSRSLRFPRGKNLRETYKDRKFSPFLSSRLCPPWLITSIYSR